ncbi:MAG: 3-hydroxyacyl-CoA dehydrogenase NAD-binding domain-containing protein [bacterium]|jgi:3-hydroxybutyryl-CoA dehydrogenase|nr:3-hydroxyacyl-CoA dehydrogenase NAD-binding domain-containing protein [Chitinophagaceae bacterium]
MDTTLANIQRVLIIGAGTMGLRIGLQAAWSGFDTIIHDIDPASFDAARKVQRRIIRHLIEQGLMDEAGAEIALARIHFTTNLAEAAEYADLVSESVVEDLEIKRAVWRQLAGLCPAHTIFTTNTSYLLPSQMAEDSGRPELFCAFHFHDVFHANVVDIMPHAGTDPRVCELLMELGTRLRQTPVFVKREAPGYVFNQMLMALIGAAGALVTHDVASIEDVDRSWMGNFKMDMGPFGILDAIGLDTAWHVTRNQQDPRSKRFAELLRSYLDQGKKGVKSGAGFYTYPDPAYRQPGFIHPVTK